MIADNSVLCKVSHERINAYLPLVYKHPILMERGDFDLCFSGTQLHSHHLHSVSLEKVASLLMN